MPRRRLGQTAGPSSSTLRLNVRAANLVNQRVAYVGCHEVGQSVGAHTSQQRTNARGESIGQLRIHAEGMAGDGLERTSQLGGPVVIRL